MAFRGVHSLNFSYDDNRNLLPPRAVCGCMSNFEESFFVRQTAVEETLACKGTLDIGFVWFRVVFVRFEFPSVGMFFEVGHREGESVAWDLYKQFPGHGVGSSSLFV